MIRSIAVLLLATATPVFAQAPDFGLTFLGPNGAGNFEYRADVTSNVVGSTAVVLAFELDGVGSILNVDVNRAVYNQDTPGNNPFTNSVTTGLWFGGSQLFFSSIGSRSLGIAETAEYLTIETTRGFPTTAFYEAVVFQNAASPDPSIPGSTRFEFSGAIEAIPEPATAALLGLAAASLIVHRRR